MTGAPENRDNVCQPHGIVMTKHSVPVLHGYVELDDAYHKARYKIFPNALESCSIGGCDFGAAEVEVWVCGACHQARADWLKANPGTNDPRAADFG